MKILATCFYDVITNELYLKWARALETQPDEKLKTSLNFMQYSVENRCLYAHTYTYLGSCVCLYALLLYGTHPNIGFIVLIGYISPLFYSCYTEDGKSCLETLNGFVVNYFC